MPASRVSPHSQTRSSAAEAKKVTYNLPVRLITELDRRAAERGRNKSSIVAVALERYFADQNRQELAAIYAEAARDPLFQSDNEAVLHDFAHLDPDWEEGDRCET